MAELYLERFTTSPSLFLEKAIKEYAASSPGDRHPAFNGGRVFDESLVGFAGGDDATFPNVSADTVKAMTCWDLKVSAPLKEENHLP